MADVALLCEQKGQEPDPPWYLGAEETGGSLRFYLSLSIEIDLWQLCKDHALKLIKSNIPLQFNDLWTRKEVVHRVKHRNSV